MLLSSSSFAAAGKMAYRQSGDSHGCIHSMMASSVIARSFWAAVLAMIMLIPRANAQIPGRPDICVCSPTVFSFTLDFSGRCPGNVSGDGILGISCPPPLNLPGGIDIVPTVVNLITVVEFDATFNVIEQQMFSEGPFFDGDSVAYTSVSNFGNLTSSFYPASIQLDIVGENDAGESLLQSLIITYTNACDVWPVFLEEAAIGWIQIGMVQDALPQYCSAVPDPPSAPTVSPAPMQSPPTVSPAPTQSPEPDPTPSPVPDPTPSPVPDPTPSPVPDPTPSPEPDPTPSPVPDPTRTPIYMSMSSDMSMSFDFEEPPRNLFDVDLGDDGGEDVVFEYGRRQQGLLRRKE